MQWTKEAKLVRLNRAAANERCNGYREQTQREPLLLLILLLPFPSFPSFPFFPFFSRRARPFRISFALTVVRTFNEYAFRIGLGRNRLRGGCIPSIVLASRIVPASPLAISFYSYRETRWAKSIDLFATSRSRDLAVLTRDRAYIHTYIYAYIYTYIHRKMYMRGENTKHFR